MQILRQRFFPFSMVDNSAISDELLLRPENGNRNPIRSPPFLLNTVSKPGQDSRILPLMRFRKPAAATKFDMTHRETHDPTYSSDAESTLQPT